MQYLEFKNSIPDWGDQYFSYKPYIIDAITETNPSKDLKEAISKIVKILDKFPDLFLKAEHLNDYDQFKTLISKIVRKIKTDEIEPCLLKIFNRLIALQESDLTVLEKTLMPISQTWAKYISIIKTQLAP